MCNASNAVIIEDVVNSLTDEDKAFTAFDATQEGMQRGTTERHKHLKGQVHANMQSRLADGTYERSLIPTPSGDAWLYHPDGYDVQNYIDSMKSPVQNIGRQPRDAVDAADASQKYQQKDKDGRLPIYANMLKAIGCGPFTIIQVGSINDEMVIAEDLGNDAEQTYKVNADGRIRIGPRMLERILSVMTLSPTVAFKIILDPDLKRIVVTL